MLSIGLFLFWGIVPPLLQILYHLIIVLSCTFIEIERKLIEQDLIE